MSIFEQITDAVADELISAGLSVRQNSTSALPQSVARAVDVMQGPSRPAQATINYTDWRTHIYVRCIGRRRTGDRTALHAAAIVRDIVWPLLDASNVSLQSRVTGLGVTAINADPDAGMQHPDIDVADEQIGVIETVLVVHHRTIAQSLDPWQ